MSTSTICGLLAGSFILWEQRGTAYSGKEITRSDAYDSARFHQKFFAHVQRMYPNEVKTLSRTDADAAFELLLHCNHHFTDWYDRLIESSGVTIEWRDRQPSIAPKTVIHWEWLVNTFDPDALLAFDLANRYGAEDLTDQVRELYKWKTVPRVIDHELTVLWARGLSDLHVHAGGVRVPQSVWQEMMAGHRNARLFKELQRIYKGENRVFLDDIEEACKHRETLLKKVLQEQTADFPQANTAQWWRWSYAMLQQERRLLVAAWRIALSKPEDAEQVKVRTYVTTCLDRYLQHKHRYGRLARQPIFDSNTGLRHFDTRYFGVLKRSPQGPRHALDVSYASSPRHEMTPIGDACAYLLETEHLQRLEIRISPYDTPQAYLRFFKRWHSLEQQVKKKHKKRDVDLRVAIHFKRSARVKPIYDPSYHTEMPVAKRLLRELDKQSAALRLALNSPEKRHRQWMDALWRIDVAGQERDSQASLFALHLRLLRGDPEAIKCLECIDANHPYHEWLQYWLRLQAEGKHRPSLAAKRLGMTVHAGEDFADLLDGLHQISSVVVGCNLGAGDGIGHGLALATEPRTAESTPYVMIPRGAHYDSLCWLFERIRTKDESNDLIWASEQLRSMIENSGRDIYSDIDNKTKCEDFLWAWRYKRNPTDEWKHATPPQKKLFRLEYCDEVLRRRQEMTPLDPERRKLEKAVLWARRSLIEEIKKSRIVIEMNPASNLRISGAESLEKLPTIGLAKEVANGLLACINTDDPGVFSSCIENEYALLLGGLIKSGLSDGEARRLLDRIREIGMHTVY
ncbi:MAG: hypothetical protein OEU26_25130 [Candidatus Tectomicrobia bacterium]|nr:hypothetical protein [Candidatus Tectomicrobia bacterium]